MKVLSLFDGGSTGLQCLKDLNIKVDKYYSSEVDKFAIQVSQDNHPEIVRLGDVTKWKDWDEEVFNVDMIIAGSPCQGFSRQGIGLNFDDPRSKLFFTFVDILNHIKENFNPKVKFMLENVVMKKEWENVITEYIGVDPININSDLFVPQSRPRVYWTNLKVDEINKKDYRLLDYLDDVILESYELIDGIKVCNTFSEASKKLISYTDSELRIKQAVKLGYAIAEIGDGINIAFPKSKTRRGRVTKNKSSCLDTSCNIGVYDQKGQIRRFTVNELERLQGLPKGYTKTVSNSQAKKILGNGWTADVIKHIFKNLKEEI